MPSQVVLRPPRKAEDLFKLLSLYDAQSGLGPLFQRVDLTGLTPAMIKDMVYGRRHLSTPDIIADIFSTPADVLQMALLSEEYQGNVISSFLDAFQHLARTVFFHIPKCLGTDVVANIGAGRLSLDKNLETSSWIKPADLLERMGQLALLAGQTDAVFVTGHLSMVDWLERLTIRPQDQIFTVIRDPIELLVSQANYAVGRLLQDPAGLAPDTAYTRECLGVSTLPATSDTSALRKLALRALQDERICQPNLICRHLSASRTASYVGALAGALQSNLEIVTATTYQSWLSARWGLGPSVWHNRSDKHISRLDAMHACHDQVMTATAHDRDFFDLVSWSLRHNGSHSIRVSEIMRRLGVEVLDGPPVAVLEDRNRRGVVRPQGPNGLPDPAVVRGEKAAGHYLRTHPTYSKDHRSSSTGSVGLRTGPTSGPRVHCNLAFRENGNAVPYLLSGWSPAEPEFIWTVGRSSSLRLPRPDPIADYILQIVAEPFVVPNHLGSQTVEVRVNSQVLGIAVLPEYAVLELAISAELLQRQPDILIDLHMPDARRPCDITQVADDRELGLCITKMVFFASPAEAHAMSGPLPIRPAAPEHLSITLSNPPSNLHDNITFPTDTELVLAFESLGENCELGLVQRRCGAEPLGLLRFSSSPFPVLMRALQHRFAELGRSDLLRVQVSDNGREYMLRDEMFGLLWHAWVLVGEKTPEEVHHRECRRIPFLVRKLIEDLTGGEKVMVYHAMQPLTQNQAEALAAAVAGFGPHTKLLWVELAEPGYPPGQVVRLGPNLLKGYIDRFAPAENAHDLSLESWLAVCRNAYALCLSRTDARGLLA